MPLVSMLARSILSYTIFLASRKIVRTATDSGETLRKNFKLHRCTNCWRLYSGELSECDFCGKLVRPLYKIYKYDYYQPYHGEDPNKREGLEKQVYNDTRFVKFEPIKPPEFKVNDDRNTRRTNEQPSGANQRRNPEHAGHFGDYRRVGNSDI